MTELLTAAQMRAIEEAAIASGEVTGLELMERAGRGVVEAIFEEWPELGPGARAVVLCGPGNNGGDGFVVARLLWEAGWDVEVFLYGDTGKLPPDARVNYERWVERGEVVPMPLHGLSAIEGAGIIIDALFGTGLVRPITGMGRTLRDICDCVDAGHGLSLSDRLPYWPPVVSLDIPSGVCSDSGKIVTEANVDASKGSCAFCVAADLTISFHSAKLGHYLQTGPLHCGRIRVVDIGLGSTFTRKNRTALAAHHGISADAVHKGFGKVLHRKVAMLKNDSPAWSGDTLKNDGHKYTHGHALIIAGGVGRGGAARMAARGALRIGAGLVTVGCPPGALQENAGALDAVMLRSVADGAALQEMLGDARINAVGIGPGLGTGAREAGLVRAVLEASAEGGRGVVLDADALTLVAGDEALFDLCRSHRSVVMTPHAGEFARLFPDIAKRLDAEPMSGPAYSKVDAARDAAARAGCVLLFKGPDTVIAAPDGRCSVNSAAYARAVPWLATAGSGDVLTGFIAGLLARGFAPMQAAETAAWLHVECALSFGPGLIAEDLPEELPKVFRALGV